MEQEIAERTEIRNPGDPREQSKRRRRAVGACFVVALTVGLPGCGDGRTLVSGKVVSKDGAPISGASVELRQQTEMKKSFDAKTDESGKFSVRLSHAPPRLVRGSFELVVSKDGYEQYKEEIKPGAEVRDKKITLRKKETTQKKKGT